MHGKHNCWPKKKGVRSRSNRKERRKWIENTNQKARISATESVRKKLQRKKTIATIQIHYNLEKNIIFTYRAKGDQLAFLLLLLHRAQGARLAFWPAW